MNDIAKNLANELKLRGWNAYDLERACEAVGDPVPQPTIHRILKGEHRDPRTSTVIKLAHGLGISEEKLRGLSGNRQTTSEESDLDLSNFRKIRIIEVAHIKNDEWFKMARLAADYGFVTFPTHDKKAYVFKCVGDGLRPRLQNGEYVVVEPSSAISPGDEIIITDKDGNKLIKKFLYERNGDLHLQSINETGVIKSIRREAIESMHFIAGIVKKINRID